MPLPQHFFISDDGGALHDTREPLWSSRPLRTNYCRSHAIIDTVEDLKSTLRHGEYAIPGGYPLFFVMGDGGASSFEYVRKNLREVMEAFKDAHRHSPMRPVEVAINYEDGDLTCDGSGARIPSAYAED